MIYIALGSNLGNRLESLQRAVALMKERCMPDLQCSIVIETEAIMLDDDPEEFNKPYLNMIAFGTCIMTPHQLLTELQDIERKIGKPEVYVRWSPRVIDLDILLFNDEVINSSDLIIPHAELKNRPFLHHLMGMVGFKGLQIHTPEASRHNLAVSPKLVGVVNITADSFSDGGSFLSTNNAIAKSLELSQDGASVVELGAQSTRPNAQIIGVDAEYAKLAPVLEKLQGRHINISIDSFWDEVINKIIDKYDVSWINDVKGDLSEDTLKAIADKGCNIAVMHSLAVPARKDIRISDDVPSIVTVMDWAKNKIDRLMKCGFSLDKIIVDPGIGFSKSPYQDISLLRDVGQMKELGCQILVGHSRKFFMTSFTDNPPSERDMETIAVSQVLQDKVDFLRVHNVKDHMRFFVAQGVVGGR